MTLLVVLPDEQTMYKEFFTETAEKFLSRYGITLTISPPQEALAQARAIKPQVCMVVADVSTNTALRKLGVTGDYPIIALGDKGFQIPCLENGANFFQITPHWCNVEVLLASYCAAASLNMNRAIILPSPAVVVSSLFGVTVHDKERIVMFENKKVLLPSYEFSMFKYLLRSANQRVSMELLLEKVWPGYIPCTRRKSMLTCAYRLRKHIQPLSKSLTLTSGKGWYMLAINK